MRACPSNLIPGHVQVVGLSIQHLIWSFQRGFMRGFLGGRLTQKMVLPSRFAYSHGIEPLLIVDCVVGCLACSFVVN